MMPVTETEAWNLHKNGCKESIRIRIWDGKIVEVVFFRNGVMDKMEMFSVWVVYETNWKNGREKDHGIVKFLHKWVFEDEFGNLFYWM